MKKFFIPLLVIILAAGCTSQESDFQTEEKTDPQLEVRSVTVDCGSCKADRKKAHTRAEGGITVSEADPLDEARMKAYSDVFFKEFPAGKQNLNASHENLESYSYNFSMLSDGKKLTVYPIMVGGNAHNTLGIYYYQDGEMVSQDIWETEIDGNAQNGWTAMQSGSGLSITIPDNVVYGFYITNTHAYGTGFNGRPFYSDASKNVNNDVHAVTFSYGGETFLGFEDLDLKGKGCDRDYNDIIFMITPEQDIITGIEIDIDDEFVCVSDDFNINLGDLGGYEAIPSSNKTTPFEFNGKIYISNYRFALNSSDELVFKLRLYGKDPWPEEKLHATEPIDPSKIKNLPGGFTLTYATKTYGSESGGIVPFLQVDLILKKK